MLHHSISSINYQTLDIFTGIITYINLTSVKLYVKLNNIFGFAKVFACFIVIAGGAYHLILGKTSNLQTGFEGTNLKFGFMALSLYNGLWYDEKIT
jgi:L-type amino acid transporter 9